MTTISRSGRRRDNQTTKNNKNMKRIRRPKGQVRRIRIQENKNTQGRNIWRRRWRRIRRRRRRRRGGGRCILVSLCLCASVCAFFLFLLVGSVCFSPSCFPPESGPRFTTQIVSSVVAQSPDRHKWATKCTGLYCWRTETRNMYLVVLHVSDETPEKGAQNQKGNKPPPFLGSGFCYQGV